ncbi:MAG TPA: ABC transporter substrate-binding protein [Pyrinomonadaceae bacterium]|nr:ABC transporter substrate-binding protein [Pyrinomonadaceae bacterium]
MRLKLFRAVAPALALFICLGTGCQTQPVATNGNANRPAAAELPREKTTGGRGGNLSYRLSAAPKTFNYIMAADEPTNLVAFFLLASRPVEFDHDRQDYAPALAESWRRSDDMRSVEITLRDGLKFSDGQPLTSEDVAFTLRALYDPKVASPIYSDAMKIGDKPFEARVVDPRRLTVVFPEPVLVPENYLSNLGVLPRHALEPELQKGAFDKAYGVTADPKSVVTSGKFMVEASAPGERVVLRRNPNYWMKDSAGSALPYLDTLTLEVITDENNAVARLRQGALDIYDRLRPADFASLRDAQGAGARAYDLGPGLYSDTLWFNLNPGKRADGKPYVDPVKLAWFADARFRRAVSHAVDRQTIARNVWLGLATPLHGFITPGNRAWMASDLPRHEYDLERARAMLREAGFQTRGTAETPELFDARGNRVAFTILAPAGTKTRVDSAAVVQEDLRRLGMDVQVAPVENAQVSERINQTYDYEAVFFGIVVTEPDPSSYVALLRSGSPQHSWHPKQATPATDWERRIDELTAAQARETDQARRRELFREIQQIMAEQLPVIPVVSRHIPVAASPRVGNYRPSPLPPFSLWNAEELFVRQ